MVVGGPGPPWGVRGLGCQLGASLPQGYVASPDPSPSRERVRGRWPGEVRACPVGPGCSALYRVVTDDYAGPALLQVGIPTIEYRQWLPGPPRGRFEPAGGATTAIWPCIT